MTADYDKAIISGVERVSAWGNLLDQINVFPIADGDTGRNLIITLSPLRQLNEDREKIIKTLMLSARGNSGNIAAQFFSGFLKANSFDALPEAVKIGRDNAWQAVNDPIKGTMLTVFDALAEALIGAFDEEKKYSNTQLVSEVLDQLEKAVHSTVDLLPRLKEANVVDAGALGMFIFLEGFFNALIGNTDEYRPIMDVFKDKLSVSPSFKENFETGYCVDMVLQADDDSEKTIKKLSETDKNVVVIKDKDYIKVHLHTDDKAGIRSRLESSGNVVSWSDDDLRVQIQEFKNADVQQSVHIMTDAAGSVTQKNVQDLGLTLLNSYILSEDKCMPETHLNPELLYDSMAKGVKASTSQASDYERHQCYHSVLSRYPKALYLCVGSVYTRNYNVVMEWKKQNDPHDRLIVIDTGTASGCLGIIAIAAARYSRKASNLGDIINFAKSAIKQSKEYLFLEKLQYLAAGGRMSKTGAFFGDMFNVKPIVSPTPEGASKVGIARSKDDQLKFLHEKLEKELNPNSKALIMLEYTDNRSWVCDTVKKEIEHQHPDSEIILQPLSLTTGVHTGPGTWGIAYLDKMEE